MFGLLTVEITERAIWKRLVIFNSLLYEACKDTSQGFVAFNYSDGLLMYCNGKEWRSLRGESSAFGNTKINPGKSCKDIKQKDPNLPSGVY